MLTNDADDLKPTNRRIEDAGSSRPAAPALASATALALATVLAPAPAQQGTR